MIHFCADEARLLAMLIPAVAAIVYPLKCARSYCRRKFYENK